MSVVDSGTAYPLALLLYAISMVVPSLSVIVSPCSKVQYYIKAVLIIVAGQIYIQHHRCKGALPGILSWTSTTKDRDGDGAEVAECLGPKAILRVNVILNPMGGILLTHAGNVILREIDVAHPAAKNMIELSRTQDEECADDTTSVIILGAQSPPLFFFLSHSPPSLSPSPVTPSNTQPAKSLRSPSPSSSGTSTPSSSSPPTTKSSPRHSPSSSAFSPHRHRRRTNAQPYQDIHRHQSDMMCTLALQAVCTVAESRGHGVVPGAVAAAGEGIGGGRQGHVHRQTNADIKRYARVEKIPVSEIEESRGLSGVLLNKDIAHPAMRRRIILLDLPLEYKKGESQTNMEFSKVGDWARAQEMEERHLNARKTLHPTGHRSQNWHDRNVPIVFPNNSFGLASNNAPSMRSTSFEPLVFHKVIETQ
ncbi:hypothetical protein CVT25_001020 [Psilocybe cyanescens]|uniref:Uncharacterized protein n=1 Tax=Psilocybe cyanescens TaxID=93625 RepID=A0A409X8K4_PSICY|nr:hypothetical protein CVT25_001020 [Psilocybe cyanescens]